jgi:CRISPR-associated endonuclease/helicase Cas3
LTLYTASIILSQEMTQKLLLQIWGKAGTSEPKFHPALHHMLDVGAVALELLPRLPKHLQQKLTSPTPGKNISPKTLAFFVACHDLGKISPGFQEKVPWLKIKLRKLGLLFPSGTESKHGRVTRTALKNLLPSVGVSSKAAKAISVTLGGHHGVLPSYEDAQVYLERGLWEKLRISCFHHLQKSFEIDSLTSIQEAHTSWLLLLGGFTSVTDWIGSSYFFPFAKDQVPNAEYLSKRRALARKALDEIGWTKWLPPAPLPSFPELFTSLSPEGQIVSPRGIQTTVNNLSPKLGPSTLLLIEAATGSGKTEAALQAALHLCSQAGLGGIYYALPTQATSNQMFGRVQNYLESICSSSPQQLQLVHGLRDRNQEYVKLRFQGVDTETGAEGLGDVIATEWFRARKRGVLSPFAVGTIDQALLATLPCKHFFVRLFGLAGKVLILDEVHAYDAFMSRILDELLGWLRQLGSSVILLSATLPRKRRKELAEAWGGVEATSPSPHYPRVTRIQTGSPVETLPGPTEASRTVKLERLPQDLDKIAAQIDERLAQGGCVAWIVNRVQRAQDAFLALKKRGFQMGHDLELFHARLPVGERARREQVLLNAFSRRGRRPQRCVVVATQVIEQSLDLDFDFMVSDLAPIDLLIQRAGRLHRHHRPSRPHLLELPRLGWSCSALPETAKALEKDCLPYAGHILLRTRLLLEGRKDLSLPEENDSLLAQVYEDKAVPSEELRNLWEESQRSLKKTIKDARNRVSTSLVSLVSDAKPRKLFRSLTQVQEEDDPSVYAKLQAKTRDIDASVTLVCLRFDAEGNRPHLRRAPDAARQRELQEQSVTLSGASWVPKICSTFPAPPAWRRPPLLRFARMAVFDERGMAWNEEGPIEWIRIDPELGIVLGSQSRKEVAPCLQPTP